MASFLHSPHRTGAHCPGKGSVGMRNFALLAAAAALVAAAAIAERRPSRPTEPAPVWSIGALSADETRRLARDGGLD